MPESLLGEVGDRIRLGSVVRELSWRRGEVEVWATSAAAEAWRVRARAAVVTLPIGVLRVGPGDPSAVRFCPDPPRLRRALAGLEMGPVVRVTLAFRRAPWLATRRASTETVEHLSFLHLSRAPFQVAWTAYPVSAPTITLWSGGALARELDGSAETVETTALGTLARALGTSRARLGEQCLGSWHHDWSADPFARGAYSYALVGGAEASKALARPIERTLFFAGEATADDEMGTVEGALVSGLRAARQVDAALENR